MSVRFHVMIPARLSSSRLPEKALADIGGKPMVVRAAEQALKTAAQSVMVATDHERIKAACTLLQWKKSLCRTALRQTEN